MRTAITACSTLLLPLSLFAQTQRAESAMVKELYKKSFGETEQPTRAEDAPNFLFITSDQHHWMCMGYNDPDLKTPNLDRLAAMGTIYDRAYTVNPVSTPTRASMITGMYPSQHGAYALGTKLFEDVPCIGDYLNEVGYESTLIGKAHFQPLRGNAEYPSLEAYPVLQDLDFWREYNGPFYGFDNAEMLRNHADEAHVGQHYLIWIQDKLKREGKPEDAWKDWFRKPTGTNSGQNGTWNIPIEYHYNEWTVERTNAYIEKYAKSKEPFFLWASFMDPHPQYLAPSKWSTMYKPEDMKVEMLIPGDMDDMPHHYRMTRGEGTEGWTKDWSSRYQEDNQYVHGMSVQNKSEEQLKKDKAIYYGMISYLDHSIGEILDKLESEDLLENTVVVFTTDHGNQIGEHGLNAKGVFAFEADLKIPMIVTYKNHFPEGKRSDALMSIVDLAPSFLAMTGAGVPNSMTGLDITELWRGEVDKIRDHVIVENHFSRTKFYQKSYITDRYKITWYMNSEEGELFDLENDPDEHNNLWNNPDFKELKHELLLKALQGDMMKEACPMPRIAVA